MMSPTKIKSGKLGFLGERFLLGGIETGSGSRVGVERGRVSILVIIG